MIRRPPRSTRTDTLFPYTTLFRSLSGVAVETAIVMLVYLNLALKRREGLASGEGRRLEPQDVEDAVVEGALLRLRPKAMTVAAIFAGLLPIMLGSGTGSEVMRRIEIGRANVCTPATNTPLVVRLLLE